MDRKRVAEIFEFDYTLEMYKPADKRRWGYYALPICSATGSSGNSTRRRTATPVSCASTPYYTGDPAHRGVRDAVDAEIADLARWLDLELN